MEIRIVENSIDKIAVVIECQEINQTVIRLKKHILNFKQNLVGIDHRGQQIIELNDIYYLESVDNRTFIYTKDKELETKYRLYEIENNFSDSDLFRISKSQVVNLKYVKTLRPQLDRTMILTLVNQEKLYVSRKYTRLLKKKIGI